MTKMVISGRMHKVCMQDVLIQMEDEGVTYELLSSEDLSMVEKRFQNRDHQDHRSKIIPYRDGEEVRFALLESLQGGTRWHLRTEGVVGTVHTMWSPDLEWVFYLPEKEKVVAHSH